MARKQHPADRYAAAQIARAVRFSAFYSAGRDGRAIIECASAAEAIAEAERLTREIGRHGRRALAYAITPEGASFPIGARGYHRAPAMLSARSGDALSPLPSVAPSMLPDATANPPNHKGLATMPNIITRKFNADRAATRTGQPHTIIAVAGGYQVVPIVAEAPAPVAATTRPVSQAPRHPNQCTACGVKFRSYSAYSNHLCAAGDTPLKPAVPERWNPDPTSAQAQPRRTRTPATAPGEMPATPDFSANTHKPYRAKLARLVELATAGDADGLAAVTINPTSTSPRAMIRYRNAAIAALRARG